MSGVLRDDALTGRVVLVTGGGTGIGRATALACAEAGADIVLCGRRPEPLDAVAKLVADTGRHAVPIPCDVREPDQVTALVRRSIEAFGHIDVLVNGAGGQFLAPAEEISVNGWRAVHPLGVEAAWSVTPEVAVASTVPRRTAVVVFISFSPRPGTTGPVPAAAARAAV